MSSKSPPVYVNFDNKDHLGRVRLNTVRTVKELNHPTIKMREGLVLKLYDKAGTAASGEVMYATDQQCWVVVVDPASVTTQLTQQA